MPLRRRFLDLPGRQLHYREAKGTGLPLLMLHLLPGSSRQMVPLMKALDGKTILAPDMAGLGDSDPHSIPSPVITDYAADVLAMLDALSLDQVDLYGSHTGSCIAVELATQAPARVRRLVLDGVALFEPAEAAELLSRYIPAIEPDVGGLHLLQTHNFCRDQILFWPWFERTAQASRKTGLPPARDLHSWVLEVLKGLDGFPQGYRAAFSYDMRSGLAALPHPALCIAAGADTLEAHSRQAAALLPDGRLTVIEKGASSLGETALAIRSFLDQ